jgi:hypothetical protein
MSQHKFKRTAMHSLLIASDHVYEFMTTTLWGELMCSNVKKGNVEIISEM